MYDANFTISKGEIINKGDIIKITEEFGCWISERKYKVLKVENIEPNKEKISLKQIGKTKEILKEDK